MTEWKPFCSHYDTGVTCPKCGGDVAVREKGHYFDGDIVDAVYVECHARIEVAFSDPEVLE